MAAEDFYRIVDEDAPQLLTEYKRAANHQSVAYIKKGKLIVTTFNPQPKLTRTIKRAIRNAVDYQADKEAELWAKKHSAKLVRDVDQTTKAAIRDLVVKLHTKELTQLETATAIAKIIGLTPQQATTIAELAGNSGALDAYVKSALQSRAELIALNETLTAANMGLQIAYEKGLSSGILKPGSRKVWQTEHDSSVCAICRPMYRKQAQIGDKFSNGLLVPPAHPRCRCTVSLNIAS